MKKHNYFVKLAALALALVLTLSLTACGGSNTDNSGDNAGDEQKPVVKIAVPNDTTNEARALLLLQENGIIKLKDGVGITATKNDIEENPYNVEIVEAEAAQLPNQLQDVDYAVINSNYAINAGLNPVKDSLADKGITLNIQVFNDYVQPNTAVEDGAVDANYFQHLPYLEDFNAQNGTHIVSISAVHVEPMGLYGGKQTTLDAVSASK